MPNVTKTSIYRILVVDDDKDIVQTIKGNLELDGYEVLTALDGRTCLQLAREHRPDLIILDLNLPDIDGIKACMNSGIFPSISNPAPSSCAAQLSG